MSMLEIRGIHRVAADEPVHLIEVAIDGSFDDVDWGAITQALPNQPREDWQTVYDEQELPALPDGRARGVFFFHYLDLDRELITPAGSLVLPSPTPTPSDLAQIVYEAP
jgi:hypothetical protein